MLGLLTLWLPSTIIHQNVWRSHLNFYPPYSSFTFQCHWRDSGHFDKRFVSLTHQILVACECMDLKHRRYCTPLYHGQLTLPKAHPYRVYFWKLLPTRYPITNNTYVCTLFSQDIQMSVLWYRSLDDDYKHFKHTKHRYANHLLNICMSQIDNFNVT